MLQPRKYCQFANTHLRANPESYQEGSPILQPQSRRDRRDGHASRVRRILNECNRKRTAASQNRSCDGMMGRFDEVLEGTARAENLFIRASFACDTTACIRPVRGRPLQCREQGLSAGWRCGFVCFWRQHARGVAAALLGWAVGRDGQLPAGPAYAGVGLL